ncbi:unnamed protein product [Nezara viridula]|uniref:Uncharacterized protein n=1 Tax=Nezara viridula TaxID=85310 RepID=A0A9P0HEH0_NEZVI|nr:unnamed protein product [Nezara viridula]
MYKHTKQEISYKIILYKHKHICTRKLIMLAQVSEDIQILHKTSRKSKDK